MANNNQHKQYGLEDFRRYRDGEMSFGEQHHLEKQLMEDPFLEEAYEGFLLMTEDNLKQAAVIKDLEARLYSKKTAGDLKAGSWVYLAAAAIILCLGLTWLVSVRSQKVLIPSAAVQKNPVLAPEEEPEMKPGPTIASRSAERSGERTAVHPIEKPRLSSGAASGRSYTGSPKGLSETGAVDSTGDGKAALPASGSIASVPAARQKSVGLRIRGLPRDENGAPLPGAAVFSSSERSEAVTDSNGNFVVIARPGDSLRPAMAGSKGKALNVGQADSGNKKLEADSIALNEVVVVGYGSQKKSSVVGAVARDVISKPEPAVGWEVYQNYLTQESDSSGIAGEVNLSFLVGVNGALSDFKGKGNKRLLKKAIGIIKSGPAWLPGKENNTVATLRVNVMMVFKKK
jgi:hypothetical protein